MKQGHAVALMLTFSAALSGQAEAANGWDDLGGILNQACSAGSGSVALGDLNVETSGAKMQWLCQLQSIHAFINDNILNGDWEDFASSVAGDYLGKFIGYAGQNLGVGALNNFTANLNESMKGGYNQFRQMLYGSVGLAFNSRRSINEGADPDSVSGMAYNAIKSNPALAVAEQMARMRDSMDATSGLEKAYEAKRVQDEARKALEVNTAQATNNATAVIGTPGRAGVADRYIEDARTALSNREVAEVQVQIAGEAMRQEATMNVALMNQLGEMVQQQVMTNVQLMKESDARIKGMMSNEAQLNALVENEALENKMLASQYAGEIRGAYANLSNVIKAQDIKLIPAGQ